MKAPPRDTDAMDCPHIPTIPYTQFSELVHTQAAAGRIPINGTLEITHGCNLRCIHCYCGRPVFKEEISLAEAFKIIDELAAAGCLWLLITGGEPLSRPDFPDIYLHAKKRGLIVTLFTNGTLMTPRIADCLREYPPFAVEISLYGATRETYEAVTRVRGSFDQCMRAIHLLLERDLPLKLKTMLMAPNHHELWDMKRFARDLGVSFRFDPFLNPKLDESREPCRWRLSPEEVVSFDLADDERAAAWREFCDNPPTPVATEALYACSAGRSSFHVTPQGELNLCLMVPQPAYDLTRGSFQVGWHEIVPGVLSRKRNRKTGCGTCDLRILCTTCPGWAELECGDPEEPVPWLCDAAYQLAEALGLGRVEPVNHFGGEVTWNRERENPMAGR